MSVTTVAPLSCNSLSVRVPGRLLVEDLDLALEAGQFIAILGRNGAGKTLTLHTLAGLRAPHSGTVHLGVAAMTTLHRRTIAQQLALLPQDNDDVFPATVLDTALSGRHPHIAPFSWESAADRAMARDALREMAIYDLMDRDVATLSGGERRRLAVAQVLTQAPAVYLLDEPTNHLDPQHQLDVLQVFAKRARAGACVLASLHDVNLAARHADRCLLLYGDGRWTLGPTAQVLDDDTLSELYATTMESLAWRGGRVFVATGAAGAQRQ